MKLSTAGATFIASLEGTKLVAYQDVAGVWTIGCGHTGDVNPGDHITQDQAMSLLLMDTARFARAVDFYTNVQTQTNQNGFDAMVSLAYNIGVNAFLGSSVLKKHLAADWYGAQAAFLLWDKAHIDGCLCTVPGLLNRRKQEAALYLKAV
jgi:lysozyme